ncbi:hypothetical protein PIB30_096050 [Stylosanthes scabra]|uniref:Uncharacterized protein n=1 Tax=Stylosanthes scabra TaxID=79078 RepID=A0ABU6WX10_9FABA|nr:hypothetical protein [Stylosanthes scabra]
MCFPIFPNPQRLIPQSSLAQTSPHLTSSHIGLSSIVGRRAVMPPCECPLPRTIYSVVLVLQRVPTPSPSMSGLSPLRRCRRRRSCCGVVVAVCVWVVLATSSFPLHSRPSPLRRPSPHLSLLTTAL